MDQIELSSFEFETIIGILPKEREKTQPIQIELTLGLDLEKAGTVESLADSVNYARVQEIVVFVAREGRWHLIESLALALCRVLLVEPSQGENQAGVKSVEVSIKKPRILAPTSVPGVRIKREVDWLHVDAETPGIGVVVLPLAHTLNTWVWRIELAPGAKWEIPAGMATFVLAGLMESEKTPVTNGERLTSLRVARNIKAIEPTTLLVVGNNAS